MAQVYSPETTSARPLALPLRANLATGALALLFLLLCTTLAIYSLQPPGVVGADAPATEFSSGRALKHLSAISRKPHSVGTAEHAVVRDYILQELRASGLEPEVQKTVVSNKLSGSIRVATVENVAARLKGTGAGKALMLVAHYDTVSISPGASDDGSSVAALLETLRALKAGPPLANDVIFLFTDGEELGLLGAKAFTEEHAWSKDVGLALNFESRGTGGPAVMFETSSGNGRMIREFAQAVPRPSANSLAYEIYRLMPNDTDLTVFREARLPGFNFANIDGFQNYHSQSDDIENFDERTLQHKGSYALALARRFGNVRLGEAGDGGNAVYFDLLGLTLLHYPSSLVLPLTALTAALLAVLAALGFRRRKLTLAGSLGGLLALVLSAGAAFGVAAFGWWLVGAVQAWAGANTQNDLYQDKLYFAGFVAVAVGLAAALYNLFRKKVSVENLTFGALLCWLILLAAVSVTMPGGSYVLTWPLLFGLVPLALMLRDDGARGMTTRRFIVMSLCAVPAVILLVPMIYQTFVAFGVGMVGAVMVPVVLLFGLLVPYFTLTTSARRWVFPGGAALVGVCLVLLAAFTASFDRRHPQADNVSYVLNTDLGKAVWASTDERPDEWTAQFFKGGAERGSLIEYIPSNYKGFLKGAAPQLPLAAPELRLLDDRTADGVRTVRLSVNSPYPAGYITAPAEGNTQVLATTVRGQRFANEPRRGSQSSNSWMLNYYAAPADGLELTLEVKPSQPLKLRVVGQDYRLPEIPGSPIRPRPDDLMPAPFSNSDTTQVSRTYTF
jgi:Peptidase family M28